MVPKRRLSPRAIRLAALLPFAPFVSLGVAACGGSDYLPDDAGGDSAPLAEASVGSDGTAKDAGADATGVDATVGDDANGGDGSEDALDASDASAEDGSDSASGSDASEDASNGADTGSGGPDAADASPGAADASDASPGAADASDASPGAADASDASLDAADASDGADASDASDDSGGSVITILGQATDFAVFGTATVTNGGATTIDGDLGCASATAIGTTEPTVVPPFAQHLGDNAATAALADIEIAYNELIPGNLPGCALLPADVGGMTITPGIYCFSSTAAITGVLTLDAQSNPNAVWVFQVASSLTVNVNSGIVIKPGTGSAGQVCNSYWQVSSAATLVTSSVFGGNILASAGITLGTGVTVLGRAFSWNGGVTMLSNVVDITGCAAIAPVP